jgi:hypothetical protein
LFHEITEFPVFRLVFLIGIDGGEGFTFPSDERTGVKNRRPSDERKSALPAARNWTSFNHLDKVTQDFDTQAMSKKSSNPVALGGERKSAGRNGGRRNPGHPLSSLTARKSIGGAASLRRELTIKDLVWTREEAMQVRAQLATFAPDWDDPAMDIYNEV